MPTNIKYIYIFFLGGEGRCLWWEMYSAAQVQILDEADCISHSTNTFGKGMNPNIFYPAMDK